MIGLPEFSKPGKPVHVRVFPMPGRQVQDGERPVDRAGGGRWLPAKGRVVEWSEYHYAQLLAGEILLHHPPCDEHEFGNDKDGECASCGRDAKAAAEYDAHAKPARDRARKARGDTPAASKTPQLHDHAAATTKQMESLRGDRPDLFEHEKEADATKKAASVPATKKAE